MSTCQLQLSYIYYSLCEIRYRTFVPLIGPDTVCPHGSDLRRCLLPPRQSGDTATPSTLNPPTPPAPKLPVYNSTMFNRSNLPSVPNPFGSGGQRPSPQGYSNPNQAPPRYDNGLVPVSSAGDSRDYDVPMTDASAITRGYGAPPPSMGRSPQQMPGRPPVGRPTGGPSWMLNPSKSPNENYTFGNLYVSHPGYLPMNSDLFQALPYHPRISPLPETVPTSSFSSMTSMSSPPALSRASLQGSLACQTPSGHGRTLV